jgi:hypothetical protein
MGAPNRSSPLLPDATSEEQPTVRLQNSRVRNSASNQQNMLMLFAIAAEVSQQQCSAQVEVDPA